MRSTSPSEARALRELLQRIERYPLMYLPEWRYPVLVAFVQGYDAALDNAPLAGFQDWIAQRVLGRPTSLVWSTVIASRQVPAVLAGDHSAADLSAEQGDAAARDAIRLLDEFLAERERDQER